VIAIKAAVNEQAGLTPTVDLPVVPLANSPFLDRPLRSEEQARAERAVNRLRTPPLSGRSVQIDWYFPGSNSKLLLEVDHDEFGGRSLIDVTDSRGEQFPYEDLELQGKPLADVLDDFVRDLPELEMPE
jgi:hypothetical protein